jgi:hypothetical protein
MLSQLSRASKRPAALLVPLVATLSLSSCLTRTVVQLEERRRELAAEPLTLGLTTPAKVRTVVASDGSMVAQMLALSLVVRDGICWSSLGLDIRLLLEGDTVPVPGVRLYLEPRTPFTLVAATADSTGAESRLPRCLASQLSQPAFSGSQLNAFGLVRDSAVAPFLTAVPRPGAVLFVLDPASVGSQGIAPSLLEQQHAFLLSLDYSAESGERIDADLVCVSSTSEPCFRLGSSFRLQFLATGPAGIRRAEFRLRPVRDNPALSLFVGLFGILGFLALQTIGG